MAPQYIASRRLQRGISSILFMLLSGLSLGAMVFGAIYYVRGLQSQSVTVHALTQAQLKAWGGLEALRQHLFQLGAAEAAKLPLNQAVSFDGLSGVTASVVDVRAADSVSCGGGTRVGFNITGSSGGANALLAATFCAKGSAGSAGTGARAPAVNIKGNLDLGGDLSVLGDDKSRVVVDGKVTGSGSLMGISNLYATGDISLGGSVGFDNLFSEGKISLSGTGLYSSVQSLKDISLSGGVGVGSLSANGEVSIASNSVTDLSAIGNVLLGSGSKLGSLKTRGNVVASDAVISGNAQVALNYEEKSAGSVASGNYGGSLTTPVWNANIKMSRVPGLVVNITPLNAKTITMPLFDAYAYQSLANYAFERVGNDTKVTVKNVSGIPDGSYFLTGSNDTQDYLCTTSSYSAASCTRKICAGYSAYTSCFSYGGGKWSIAGQTMAPGLLWFKGSVDVGSGTYYNSWIATGDIGTSGGSTTYAVNYAGYANTCSNSVFPALVPGNFCSASSLALLPVAAGNIAFGAGGYVGNNYSGGKINLAASNDVYGSVLAGDILSTAGSTVVHGYVSAGRAGNGQGSSSLGASTKLDLRNLPSSFNPGDTGASGASEPLSASLLWSRYR